MFFIDKQGDANVHNFKVYNPNKDDYSDEYSEEEIEEEEEEEEEETRASRRNPRSKINRKGIYLVS